MVVLVGINTLNSIIFFEIVLNKQLKDLLIDRNLRKSNKNAPSNLGNSDLIEPWMPPNIGNLESFFWICVQNILHQVPGLRRYELRD